MAGITKLHTVITVLIALLATACSDDPAPTVETPAAATAASTTVAQPPSLTPAAVPTLLPDEPTGPGPQPGAACPVQQEICALAAMLQVMVQRNDVDGFMSIVTPKQFRCTPGNVEAFPGQPQPPPDYGELHEVCAGATAGELRPGFIAGSAGEGFAATRERFRANVAMYFDSASRALRASRDVYGSGEPKIGSIFCNRARLPAAGPCDLDRELAISVTYVTSGDIGTAGRRLTFNVWVHRLSATAPLRAFGTGMSLPPNHVLIPHDGDAVYEDGSRGTQSWYAWTP